MMKTVKLFIIKKYFLIFAGVFTVLIFFALGTTSCKSKKYQTKYGPPIQENQDQPVTKYGVPVPHQNSNN